MPFEFEKFTQPEVQPLATIDVTGLLSFNLAAVVKYGIRTCRYCVLYSERDGGVFSVRLSDKEEAGIIPICSEWSDTYILAKEFFDWAGIDYKQTRSYPLEKCTCQKHFIVLLHEPVEVHEDGDDH